MGVGVEVGDTAGVIVVVVAVLEVGASVIFFANNTGVAEGISVGIKVGDKPTNGVALGPLLASTVGDRESNGLVGAGPLARGTKGVV